jgi:hypothetical protein
MEGGNATITVNVAVLLVVPQAVLPGELATTTSKVDPVSLALVAGVV